MESKAKKPGNYLAIDGGPAGLVALYILKEIFHRIEWDVKSTEELLVYLWFDLMVASGTGGLVVILLGRLHFNLSQAIAAYIKLLPALSVGPTNDEEEKRRNTALFNTLFTKVLEEAGFNADTPMVDDKGPKIAICVSNTANTSVPCLIRSYPVRDGNDVPPCTILQAAGACVASSDRFLPVEIGPEFEKLNLVDATISYQNPVQLLMQEAEKVAGNKRNEEEVATLISIGIRIDKATSKSEDPDHQKYKLMENMASSTHETMRSRLCSTEIYFRWDPELQFEAYMDPYKTFPLIAAYKQHGPINDQVNKAIESLKRRPAGVKLMDINSVTVVEITPPLARPSLVKDFIGREDILANMRKTHFTNRPTEGQDPTITVLTGLGGSGKTQIALKFVAEYESRYPSVPVYFLNATSEETLKDDYERVIRSRGAAYRSKSYQDALEWLATLENWLVILDNADDPNLRPYQYIPKCRHGNVIITTRNDTFSTLAPDSNHRVEGLSETESETLLLKVSRYEGHDENKEFARQISSAFACIPLAIRHAGSYISIHKCLSSYLDMYNEQKAKFLAKAHPELPQDYDASVATTIQMSLDHLSQHVIEIMVLFSRLQASAIARLIIERAAKNRFIHTGETEELVIYPQSFGHADTLMKLFCTLGMWDAAEFNDSIHKCLQYSLLQVIDHEGKTSYSMHILVQSYLESFWKYIRGYSVEELAVRLLGASLASWKDPDYSSFTQMAVPHIKRIKKTDVIEMGDRLSFRTALYLAGNRLVSEETGKFLGSIIQDRQDAPPLLGNLEGILNAIILDESKERTVKQVIQMARLLLGESTFNVPVMMLLRSLLLGHGRMYQEAMALCEQSLEPLSRRVAKGHPVIVSAMNCHASWKCLSEGIPQPFIPIEMSRLLHLVGQNMGILAPQGNDATTNLLQKIAQHINDIVPAFYQAIGTNGVTIYRHTDGSIGLNVAEQMSLYGDGDLGTLKAVDLASYYQEIGREDDAEGLILTLSEYQVEKADS